MSDKLTEAAVDAKYQSSFGRLAGYLPKDRKAADRWRRNLKHDVKAKRSKAEELKSKAVRELKELIEVDGIVRMYVTKMIDQTSEQYGFAEDAQEKEVHEDIHMVDVDELLHALDHITTTAPLYYSSGEHVGFPISALFMYMMMTQAGEAVFRNRAFNEALIRIQKEWCLFLDSPKSQYVLNTDENGWLSPHAYKANKLSEFVHDKALPHWGWRSFNDYFHREIKPKCRPISQPEDPKVIVSANDGTVVNIARNVKRTDDFWLKGQPYSLVNMLNNRAYVDRFVGGDVFQSFLSGADYHRWRSPIDGVVVDTRIFDGLMWSDAESAGFDLTSGTYSQGYEASVNTRGLVSVVSDDPVIGMVCVMPIGMTEISSVTFEVKVGDRLKKGDELGYFSYGGSSLALVFQAGAIDKFTVKNRSPGTTPDDGPPIKVNAQIAVAK